VAKRLFEELEARFGKRQIILSGEIEDYFMVDLPTGLKKIQPAIELFARRNGFEVVVFLDEAAKLEFASPEMSKIFDETIKRSSVDSAAGNRNQRQFVPRGNREVSSHTVDQVQGNSEDHANAQARNAVQHVAGNANSSAQNTLDQITRLLNSQRKCFVVMKNPENMWVGNLTEVELRKLKTIIDWSKHDGHSDSLSVLLVNNNRLEDFNTLADRWGNRQQFSRSIVIPRADREEFGFLLKRLRCRYNLLCDLESLYDANRAKDLNLYNFTEAVDKFIQKSPEEHNLEKLFTNEERSASLSKTLETLEQMIGLEEVKKVVRDLVRLAENDVARKRAGQKLEKASYHMVLLGNPGTGKTEVARLIGRIMWAVGLRSSREFVEVDPSKIISAYNTGDTRRNMENAITKALGGTLFIDEVYGFAEEKFGGKEAIETLLTGMENHRDNLTVIMAGYKDTLPKLYEINSGFKSRVNTEIDLPDYSIDELVQIYQSMVRKDGFSIGIAALEKVRIYFQTMARFPDFGYARDVRNEFEKAVKALRAQSSDSLEILHEMVSAPVTFNQEEAKRIIEKINSDFRGLTEVKGFFQKLFNEQVAQRIRGKPPVAKPNHCFFVGNPGTGKTSIARLLGELLFSLGLVSKKSHLVEKKPADFSADERKDGPAKMSDAFREAQGGVLFIDEAHSLEDRATISQMLSNLTDQKLSNMILVLAGYKDEIQKLKGRDAGFTSRIQNEITFDDLRPDDLVAVFMDQMKADHNTIESGSEELFQRTLRMRLLEMSRKRYFGNTRDVIGFYHAVQRNLDNRIAESERKEVLPMSVNDLDLDLDNGGLSGVKEILRELDSEFVGLKAVKQQIKALALKIEMEKKRFEATKGNVDNNFPIYHMRFVGPPGTGKTTVARIMGNVLHALGIIAKPGVKEIRAVDLKASFVGQTKDKVNGLFEESEGQLVLIDEIYGLKSSSSSDNDSFAREAIDTLVGCMTDRRNASTVLIIAGYKEATDDFLRENQGLASRFPCAIEFPDYSAEECVEILHRLMEKERFSWPKDEPNKFDALALELFTMLAACPPFGNARTVGSVFESIKSQLNQRLHDKESYEDRELFEIQLQDLEKVAQAMGLAT
jgi:SpoVK/Ycf46/Vps4 family AAA+-type ATPase